MNDLRVCLVCDNFFPKYDGVVYAVNAYHKYFSQHAKSLLIVPKIGKQKQSQLANIHYVPSTKLVSGYVTPYPYSDSKIKKVLERFKPNIIHIHSPFVLGRYFANYAKKHKLPCLITFHTQYYLDFKNTLKSRLISKLFLKFIISTVNKNDYIYTVSKKMIGTMHTYGIKHKKISVLRNGTDLKPLQKNKFDNEINKKFLISKNDFVITFVGRVIKYKNLKLITAVAKELIKKNTNIKFMVCGDGDDLLWMKRKINKMNMQRYFIFTGSILNRELISKIYSRTNLNMMLSTFDVFNTTITEAASQSTPSIILKKSMASPYIKHGESGYLVSESPRVIANEICKIMSDMESYYLVCKHAKHDLYKTWDQVCKSASIEYLNILKRS